MIVGAVIYDSGSGSGSLLTFSNILDRRDFTELGANIRAGGGGWGLGQGKFTCGYDQTRFKSSITLVYLIFYNNYDVTFCDYPNHPVNFLCGRKPEHPEKTYER
jgi:hypothetical protein